MELSAKSEIRVSNHLLRIYKTLCRSFGPQHWWPGESPFEVTLGAILAQNTNWRNASAAIDNIREAGLLEPKKLLKHRTIIAELIRPSGFFNLKSQRLVAFLKYFVKNYDGKIDRMNNRKTTILREELLNLPGIGYETADSILLYACSKPVFIIDTYTRRIFSRHNILEYDQHYEDIRSIFENNLPRNAKLYNEYHALIVKLGKEFCKKNEPLCNTCPLRNI